MALLLALGALGCQRPPVQVVKLHVEPATALLFVDGSALEELPSELTLRSDRSHVLFFRCEGYLPEQLVLQTRERNGAHSLEPAKVRVVLAPLIPTESGVRIEGSD
jgi:hypothetical protein